MIFVNNSKLIMNRVGISNNRAANGAAVYALRSFIHIDNSTFIANRVGDAGGTLFLGLSSVLIERSEFTNATARVGGAIFSSGANVTIRRSRFERTYGSERGGAMVLSANSMLTMDDCDLIAPSTSMDQNNFGGAILADASRLSVHNTRIIEPLGADGFYFYLSKVVAELVEVVLYGGRGIDGVYVTGDGSELKIYRSNVTMSR
jgi:hypothetical protein